MKGTSPRRILLQERDTLPLFYVSFSPPVSSIHALQVRTNQQNPQGVTVMRIMMNLPSPCNVYSLGFKDRQFKAHQHLGSHGCENLAQRHLGSPWLVIDFDTAS